MSTQAVDWNFKPKTPDALEVHAVTRVRIMGSGFNSGIANVLASKVEETLRVRGSSIQAQYGRWHGKVEDGFVIEASVAKDAYDHAALEQTLKRFSDWSGYTFFVTIEEVSAMEVF